MKSSSKVAVGVGSAALVAAAASVGWLPHPADDPRLNPYQQRCAQALSYFITQIPQRHPQFQVTFGEAHRPTWVATEYAKRGIGIKTSLHIDRLAIDLMLFRDGVYQTSSDAYIPIGNLWREIAPAFGVTPGVGTDFGDGNHFSCALGNRR